MIGSKLRLLEGGCIAYWCPGCQCAHVMLLKTVFTKGPHWTFNYNPFLPTFTPSFHETYSEPVDWDNPDGPKVERSQCHCIVTDGKIQYLSDCEHELAGKLIELPDFDPSYKL
jgi:hypothetical protein